MKNSHIKSLTIFALCCSFLSVFAQTPTEQDCFGAIPICQSKYLTTKSYSGEGSYPKEIDGTSSCLKGSGTNGTGEKNDVWYVFTVQTPGYVSFNITPNDPFDDYDWAVFNLSTKKCTDIFSDQSLAVSCNFSSTSGTTGPNGSSSYNSQDAMGSNGNAVIPVKAGENYVINISNYSSSQNGYAIDFGASTAIIYDNIPPSIDSISQSLCGASTLQFVFSENILCNTIQEADFVLTGPSGTYTLSGLTGTVCALGGKQEKIFTVNVSPDIQNGIHTLSLVAAAGSVSDLCGNVAIPSSTKFSPNLVPIKVTASGNNIVCEGSSTTLSAGGTGGTGTLTYIWTPGNNVGSSLSVTPTSNTTYSVYATDGCVKSTLDSVVVKVITLPNDLNFTSDVSQGCTDFAVAFTSTITGTYNYSWNFGNGQNASNSSTVTTLYTVPGVYPVSLTITETKNNCSTTVTKNNFITAFGKPQVDFTYTPELAQTNDAISFKSLTPQAIAWTWDFNDPTNKENSSFLQNPIHEFEETGTFCVKLFVTDVNGCSDSLVKCLEISSELSLYIPNTFTPNGNSLNETFKTYANQCSAFNLLIFDRWGEKVFETADIEEGWNGKRNNKGQQLAQGMYVYRIEAKDLKGHKQQFLGHITLLD